MLIAHDSPLRKPPVGLDRRQQIALDGIRVAADVVDLSHRRLNQTLLNLSSIEPFTDAYHQATVATISDAWSIVDNAHRFCELLRQFPSIKQNLPQFQLLYRSAKPAEALRHFIQHARNEIDALSKAGLSIWGTLTWNLKADFDAGHRTLRSLHIGTFYEGNFAAMGKLPESVKADVDNVTLHAGSHQMVLSKVVRNIEQVVKGFERDIAQQAGQFPRHSSDMLFAMTVTLHNEDDRSSKNGNDI